MSAFRLTEQYSNELLGLSGLPLLQAVEAIVNKHRTKPPRWIPVTERMPTAADGMGAGTWSGDRRLIVWLIPEVGCTLGMWDQLPTGSTAWCRLPDYTPPVPTPEDTERLAFEEWASNELNDDVTRYCGGSYTAEAVRVAWAAWQAARADAGTPDPVREDVRKLLQAFDDSRKAAAADGGLCKTLERESRELISKLRAALTGGQQP